MKSSTETTAEVTIFFMRKSRGGWEGGFFLNTLLCLKYT